MTVKDVMQKVDEDRIFYENSGGGVTFSGGEPGFQNDFLLALLEEAGRLKLHTALETNGNYAWQQLEKYLPKLNLVLFDIKHLDDAVHQRYTGAGNLLIKENMALLAKKGTTQWIPRIPLIPGVNDGPLHLQELGRWLKDLGAREVHLLPYHRLWQSKQRSFGYPREIMLERIQPLSDDDIERTAEVLRKENLAVTIGG